MKCNKTKTKKHKRCDVFCVRLLDLWLLFSQTWWEIYIIVLCVRCFAGWGCHEQISMHSTIIIIIIVSVGSDGSWDSVTHRGWHSSSVCCGCMLKARAIHSNFIAQRKNEKMQMMTDGRTDNARNTKCFAWDKYQTGRYCNVHSLGLFASPQHIFHQIFVIPYTLLGWRLFLFFFLYCSRCYKRLLRFGKNLKI